MAPGDVGLDADAESQKPAAALLERTETGQLAVDALLARLGSGLHEHVFQALTHPQAPLVETAASESGPASFEALQTLTDRAVHVLLRQVDQRDLVIALCGASPAVREKMLGSISDRARTFLLQEMAYAKADAVTSLEAQVRTSGSTGCSSPAATYSVSCK